MKCFNEVYQRLILSIMVKIKVWALVQGLLLLMDAGMQPVSVYIITLMDRHAILCQGIAALLCHGAI